MLKSFKSAGYRILMVSYLNTVVDHSSRMSNPLSTGHKLVVHILPERITQSAVPAGQCPHHFYCFQQSLFLLLGNFAMVKI